MPSIGIARMPRQMMVAAAVTLLGLGAVSLWSLRVGRAGTTAALWFEPLSGDGSPEFTQRFGSPLTPADMVRIQSIAQEELRAAFAATCITLSTAPDARYRVRVQQGTLGLAAAGSRSLPGLRGDGVISLASLAAGAVAFAPPGAGRDVIVDAIGRGIGRTAAHELAHQLLGSFQLHDPNDRLSFEYPDLGAEHFYGTLHWTLAAKPLHARYGRDSGPCSLEEPHG